MEAGGAEAVRAGMEAPGGLGDMAEDEFVIATTEPGDGAGKAAGKALFAFGEGQGDKGHAFESGRPRDGTG